MALLVEYRCRECGARTEHWVAPTPPDESTCGRCGQMARRLFGGALVTGASEPASREPQEEMASGGCGHAPDVPGVCTLTPTAARMLTARARRDNRALDREIAYQESAIKSGTLDPKESVVTTFAGGPPAPATAPGAHGSACEDR